MHSSVRQLKYFNIFSFVSLVRHYLLTFQTGARFHTSLAEHSLDSVVKYVVKRRVQNTRGQFGPRQRTSRKQS